MTDRELISRAEALGVSASYLDWRKERVQADPEVLAAIVGALGDVPCQADQTAAGPGPASRAGADPVAATGAVGALRAAAGPGGGDTRNGGRPAGSGPRLAEPGADSRAGTMAGPRVPPNRSWGFTVQLYSVRSRRSWGHGDLRDLADLAVWSARELGAGFILVNPLHAAEPAPPVSPSPYLPMTRRYTSPLYLRIEDIPEYRQLSAAERQQIERLAAPLRAANCTPELIDRNAVWAAKLRALELIYPICLSAEREAARREFAEREGAELAGWASWCALAEQHGPDWRRWPAELTDPGRAARLTGHGRLAERADFHAWLQWLIDTQLAAVQREALAAGMAIGAIGDLAVGVHPGGADAWAHQDLLVRGMSVGAPPDGFNQRGQDWAQPPWHPQRLAAKGFRPLADMLHAAFRHVGGLRVDHVMGLMRLWWVPEGMPPDRGAYVSYDHRATVAVLAGEAARAGAVAIGEDLGTVDPWIRGYLAEQSILGTSLLWFARESDGSPLRPEHWRRRCMATVGTHDVPPVSGFVTGDQVTVRARLGLLNDPEAERKRSELVLAGWQDALVRERLLPPGARPTAAEFTVALYRFLALTPALLVGVSLADAVGDRRTQNVPGTSDEYPNWQIPLCNGDGEAVLIENLAAVDLVRAVASAVAPDLAVRETQRRAAAARPE
ncbi:MAG TPA: 4-alpha-glucanotransferase [Streptosporangiaceae bacterium]|nr:4-alpha-glucanotransferase [Streptosporangiaceae bacterium]